MSIIKKLQMLTDKDSEESEKDKSTNPENNKNNKSKFFCTMACNINLDDDRNFDILDEIFYKNKSELFTSCCEFTEDFEKYEKIFTRSCNKK